MSFLFPLNVLKTLKYIIIQKKYFYMGFFNEMIHKEKQCPVQNRTLLFFLYFKI